MNSVILIGRLARDPEIRYTQSQMAVCNFTVAVNRPVRNGEQQQADFIRVVTWGRLAENCSRYLQKGKLAGVKGRIQTGSYEKDGQKHYTTEVVAENVEFLSPANAQGQNHSSSQQHQQRNDPPKANYSQPAPQQSQMSMDEDLPPGFMEIDEEDIPF